MSFISRLDYRIKYQKPNSNLWYFFIDYDTLEEAVSYLTNVNTMLRPAIITFGQQTLKEFK